MSPRGQQFEASLARCPTNKEYWRRYNPTTYPKLAKVISREVPDRETNSETIFYHNTSAGLQFAAVGAVGINPSLFLVAATSFPEGHNEYDHCGGILNEPVKIFESDLTGLPLPADAEIIAEGFMYQGEEFVEGPFGEFCGYYGELPRCHISKLSACAIGRIRPSPAQSFATVRQATIQ